MSFLGDQTSYMTICAGEGLHEESLSLSSPQELRQKVGSLTRSRNTAATNRGLLRRVGWENVRG